MELVIEGYCWWDILCWGKLDDVVELVELQFYDFEFNIFVVNCKVMLIVQIELDCNFNLVGNLVN